MVWFLVCFASSPQSSRSLSVQVHFAFSGPEDGLSTPLNRVLQKSPFQTLTPNPPEIQLSAKPTTFFFCASETPHALNSENPGPWFF